MTKRTTLFCRRVSGVLMLVSAFSGNLSHAKTIQVQCQVPGHSIARAVEIAQAGDVIAIQGTCTERVTITKDHITLDGFGTAVIRGAGMAIQVFNPLVGVEGAQGVLIKRLRVENGPAEAIAAYNGSAVTLANVTLVGSTIGLAVAVNSAADVTDSVLDGNFVGADVFTGGRLVLKGRVTANNNLLNGFDLTGSSTLEIRGAHAEANNNGGNGIILTDSQVSLLGFPPAQGSSISTNGNRANGVLVGPNASVSLFGGPGANAMTSRNNALSGLHIKGGHVLNRGGTARFVIEGNQTGITVETDGSAAIEGGLAVQNNGTGVLADGAGVFSVFSVPLPSTISNNTTRDFDARFGSRIRLVGVSVGPKVVCEPSVLSQGLACP